MNVIKMLALPAIGALSLAFTSSAQAHDCYREWRGGCHRGWERHWGHGCYHGNCYRTHYYGGACYGGTRYYYNSYPTYGCVPSYGISIGLAGGGCYGHRWHHHHWYR